MNVAHRHSSHRGHSITPRPWPRPSIIYSCTYQACRLRQPIAQSQCNQGVAIGQISSQLPFIVLWYLLVNDVCVFVVCYLFFVDSSSSFTFTIIIIIIIIIIIVEFFLLIYLFMFYGDVVCDCFSSFFLAPLCPYCLFCCCCCFCSFICLCFMATLFVTVSRPSFLLLCVLVVFSVGVVVVVFAYLFVWLVIFVRLFSKRV